MGQSKRSRPLAFKWEIWTQVGENVRAQIQFPSHRRHRVSVRGRLGQWLHQHFGVSCASLFPPRWGCTSGRNVTSFNRHCATLVRGFPRKCVHHGRRGSDAHVLWPRPVRAAALQEIVRKCNRNAKRRYKSKYLRFGPYFQGPPGDTEGIYRDGTDGVIMDLMAGYLEFGEQVVIHLHASHSSRPLQHSGKQPSRLLS